MNPLDDERTETAAPVEYPNVRLATDREVRAWAMRQGLQIGKRGRIPGDIRVAYETAHAALQV